MSMLRPMNEEGKYINTFRRQQSQSAIDFFLVTQEVEVGPTNHVLFSYASDHDIVTQEIEGETKA